MVFSRGIGVFFPTLNSSVVRCWDTSSCKKATTAMCLLMLKKCKEITLSMLASRWCAECFWSLGSWMILNKPFSVPSTNAVLPHLFLWFRNCMKDFVDATCNRKSTPSSWLFNAEHWSLPVVKLPKSAVSLTFSTIGKSLEIF